jgi:hypothetical protein
MKITNTYYYQKLRGLKRKLELIELNGGCCKKCGYNKNIASFEFHHRDPTQKEYQLDLRKLSNTSMVKLMSEVEKCDLLCANCHREVHSPDLNMNNVKLLIKEIDESVVLVKEPGKPKCLDCGCEINYTHTRCVKCNSNNRRKVVRPDVNTLLNEIKDYSQEWCANKYGVSRSSIRRWIKLN